MKTQTLTRALLPSMAGLLVAAPALACGGPAVSDFQMRVLTAAMITAPVLAALLVDRGAFALASYALNMKRRHRPTAFGPLLALVAVTVALGSVASRDMDVAVVGFALVPLAALVCGLSFVRSVIIDMRGHRPAQLVRAAAIAAFVTIALVRVFG